MLFVQKDAFLKRIDNLVSEISQNEELIEKYRKDAEYRKSIDFIIEWATEHKGMLSDDQIKWIKKITE
jgi:hypothetical protein